MSSDIETRIIDLLKKKQSIEIEKSEVNKDYNANIKSIDSQIDNLLILYDEQNINKDQQSLFPFNSELEINIPHLDASASLDASESNESSSVINQPESNNE